MDFSSYKSCIEACHVCAAYCERCATSCLKEDDVEQMAECIRLDMQCAQICRLVASFMALDSEYAKPLCRLCADICNACGDECAKHEADHCQECARACHRCAKECAAMA